MPSSRANKRPRIKLKVRFPSWPADDDDAEGESSSRTTGNGTGHAATSSESSGSPAAGRIRRITDDDRGVHVARLEVQRAAGVRRLAKKTVRFRTPPREADEKRLSDGDREVVDRAVGVFKAFAGADTDAGTDTGAGAVDGVDEDEDVHLEGLLDESENSGPLDADDDDVKPKPSRNLIDPYNIYRFESAQGPEGEVYGRALAELIQGRKKTHWMWFMFPQVAGAGGVSPADCSHKARFYHVRGGLDEARALLDHPRLGWRLRRMACALLAAAPAQPSVEKLMGGRGDAKKLQSSMTLFAVAAEAETEAAGEVLWQQVLNVFFERERDEFTVKILGQGSD